MSILLIADKPIQVLPSLAVAIGLNEAIFIQQLHYWLNGAQRSKTFGQMRENRMWIYNTPEEWQVQNFPFWSVSTIRRVINSCKSQGVLDIELELSPMVPGGRRNWYTVNYDKVAEIGSVQNEQTGVSNMNRPSVQNEHAIYIDTENTTETTHKSLAEPPDGGQQADDVTAGEQQAFTELMEQPEQPDEQKPKRKRSPKQMELDATLEALVAAFKLPRDNITDTRWSTLRGAARQLIKAKIAVIQIPALHRYVVVELGYKSSTENALVKYAADFMKREAERASKPAVGAPSAATVAEAALYGGAS